MTDYHLPHILSQFWNDSDAEKGARQLLNLPISDDPGDWTNDDFTYLHTQSYNVKTIPDNAVMSSLRMTAEVFIKFRNYIEELVIRVFNDDNEKMNQAIFSKEAVVITLAVMKHMGREGMENWGEDKIRDECETADLSRHIRTILYKLAKQRKSFVRRKHGISTPRSRPQPKASQAASKSEGSQNAQLLFNTNTTTHPGTMQASPDTVSNRTTAPTDMAPTSLHQATPRRPQHPSPHFTDEPSFDPMPIDGEPPAHLTRRSQYAARANDASMRDQHSESPSPRWPASRARQSPPDYPPMAPTSSRQPWQALTRGHGEYEDDRIYGSSSNLPKRRAAYDRSERRQGPPFFLNAGDTPRASQTVAARRPESDVVSIPILVVPASDEWSQRYFPDGLIVHTFVHKIMGDGRFETINVSFSALMDLVDAAWTRANSRRSFDTFCRLDALLLTDMPTGHSWDKMHVGDDNFGLAVSIAHNSARSPITFQVIPLHPSRPNTSNRFPRNGGADRNPFDEDQSDNDDDYNGGAYDRPQYSEGRPTKRQRGDDAPYFQRDGGHQRSRPSDLEVYGDTTMEDVDFGEHADSGANFLATSSETYRATASHDVRPSSEYDPDGDELLVEEEEKDGEEEDTAETAGEEAVTAFTETSVVTPKFKAPQPSLRADSSDQHEPPLDIDVEGRGQTLLNKGIVQAEETVSGCGVKPKEATTETALSPESLAPTQSIGDNTKAATASLAATTPTAGGLVARLKRPRQGAQNPTNSEPEVPFMASTISSKRIQQEADSDSDLQIVASTISPKRIQQEADSDSDMQIVGSKKSLKRAFEPIPFDSSEEPNCNEDLLENNGVRAGLQEYAEAVGSGYSANMKMLESGDIPEDPDFDEDDWTEGADCIERLNLKLRSAFDPKELEHLTPENMEKTHKVLGITADSIRRYRFPQMRKHIGRGTPIPLYMHAHQVYQVIWELETHRRLGASTNFSDVGTGKTFGTIVHAAFRHYIARMLIHLEEHADLHVVDPEEGCQHLKSKEAAGFWPFKICPCMNDAPEWMRRNGDPPLGPAFAVILPATVNQYGNTFQDFLKVSDPSDSSNWLSPTIFYAEGTTAHNLRKWCSSKRIWHEKMQFPCLGGSDESVQKKMRQRNLTQHFCIATHMNFIGTVANLARCKPLRGNPENKKDRENLVNRGKMSEPSFANYVTAAGIIFLDESHTIKTMCTQVWHTVRVLVELCHGDGEFQCLSATPLNTGLEDLAPMVDVWRRIWERRVKAKMVPAACIKEMEGLLVSFSIDEMQKMLTKSKTSIRAAIKSKGKLTAQQTDTYKQLLDDWRKITAPLWRCIRAKTEIGGQKIYKVPRAHVHEKTASTSSEATRQMEDINRQFEQDKTAFIKQARKEMAKGGKARTQEFLECVANKRPCGAFPALLDARDKFGVFERFNWPDISDEVKKWQKNEQTVLDTNPALYKHLTKTAHRVRDTIEEIIRFREQWKTEKNKGACPKAVIASEKPIVAWLAAAMLREEAKKNPILGHTALYTSRESPMTKGNMLAGFQETNVKSNGGEVKAYEGKIVHNLCMSMRVAGTGIELTKAGQMFVLEPQYNATTLTQFVGRAVRYGQQRNVEVWLFCADGPEMAWERQIGSDSSVKGVMINAIENVQGLSTAMKEKTMKMLKE